MALRKFVVVIRDNDEIIIRVKRTKLDSQVVFY